MASFAAGPVLVLYLVSRWGAGVTPWLMIPGLLLAVGMFTLLPVWEPHHAGHLWRLFDPKLLTSRPIMRLTGAATLVSLTFITATSATDDALLGWTLGLFSLSAGAGAVAGGYAGARLGYSRTTLVSLTAAAPALIAILLLPTGAGTLAAAAVAGTLIYASQPANTDRRSAEPCAARPGRCRWCRHRCRPRRRRAAVRGRRSTTRSVRLTPVIVLTFLLLVPAAVIAATALKGRGAEVAAG